MKIDVVIGSAYGDEGKGQTTHKLSKPESVVVRFNGGAQAGHTVKSGTTRHVFSHFGSGSLKKAKTYLSEFFVVHPIMFIDEANELEPKIQNIGSIGKFTSNPLPTNSNLLKPFSFKTCVHVSPKCYVTTPYDVGINIIAERNRGKNKHGSVGCGFGETIERCTSGSGVKLTVADLVNEDILREKLLKIKDVWVSHRINELGIACDYSDFNGLLSSVSTIDTFIHDCKIFMNNITITEDWQSLGDHFVFEGAQGLMLDQDYGHFPHVTRSNTGLKNVIKMTGHVPMQVHYITRTYTTRHGAGPLPYELNKKPYVRIYDQTNVPNQHQDHLRYSYLNMDTVINAINADLLYHTNNPDVKLVITCIDQLPSQAHVIWKNKKITIESSQLKKWCNRIFHLNVKDHELT